MVSDVGGAGGAIGRTSANVCAATLAGCSCLSDCSAALASDVVCTAAVATATGGSFPAEAVAANLPSGGELVAEGSAGGWLVFSRLCANVCCPKVATAACSAMYLLSSSLNCDCVGCDGL